MEIWKKSLQQPNLSIHSDYFLNGGDSLNAVAMLTEVEREFSILPELTGLYACRTVRRFANLLRGREADASAFHTEIPKAPKDQTYPLTAAQRSFYVLEQTDVTKTGYHMPVRFAGSSVRMKPSAPDLRSLALMYRPASTNRWILSWRR